jgi:hypothetical protein
MPIAGGPLVKVAAATSSVGDLSIQVDDLAADATALYLAISSVTGVGSVVRLPRDGGPRVSMAPPGFGHPFDCVHRLAVDAQRVYWTAASNTMATGCSIYSAPATGGTASVVLDVPFLDFVLAGADVFFSGARIKVVDETGSHLIGFDGIGRVASSGGTVASYGTPGFPSLVTADQSRVYAIDAAGSVLAIGRDGTGLTTIATSAFYEDPELVDTIVAVNGSVYWTDLALGTISLYTPN